MDVRVVHAFKAHLSNVDSPLLQQASWHQYHLGRIDCTARHNACLPATVDVRVVHAFKAHLSNVDTPLLQQASWHQYHLGKICCTARHVACLCQMQRGGHSGREPRARLQSPLEQCGQPPTAAGLMAPVSPR